MPAAAQDVKAAAQIMPSRTRPFKSLRHFRKLLADNAAQGVDLCWALGRHEMPERPAITGLRALHVGPNLVDRALETVCC